MTDFLAFGADAPAPADAPIELVGGKAWHLIKLTGAGLPVPPGFVIPTSWCRDFYRAGQQFPDGFTERLAAAVARLAERTGRSFGSGPRPLLVSVRSGAAHSMPGMMDTLLDVGLTPALEAAWLRETGNARCFWDSLRRLLRAFAETVHGAPAGPFEASLAACLQEHGIPDEGELDVAALRRLTEEWLTDYPTLTGRAFPVESALQLEQAVEAVFRSWESDRARRYRALHGLPDGAGTAVIVQAMVLGNRGGASGSGVGFTRDPATGAPGLYLDFLFGAQGEDVVSGRRSASGAAELQHLLPVVHADLVEMSRVLERLFGDVQDFEFTVERGRLYLLQCRSAKRTPLAALRTTCDLVAEGLIPPATALERLAVVDLDRAVEITVRAVNGATLLGRGTPASPGVATGPLALSAEKAATLAREGRPPILVRPDTSTADLEGMVVAAGILTREGSRTSHAALVARQLDRVAIVGCRELVLDPARGEITLGGQAVAEGEGLSLDGTTGQIYAGTVTVETHRPEALLQRVAEWRRAVAP